MIFTITFNPSIDYIIHVPSFESGIINRTDDEKILPGGKGINVATVLTNFGHQCLALGFGAGSTGKMLRRELMARGIEADLVEAESGFTRINVKMKGNPETQINGRGPVISEKNMNDLYNRLSRLAPNDFVIVSGSVPASLGKTTYAKIGSIVEKSGGHFVVDAEGDLLLETLDYHPFLIKPNLLELEGIAKKKLESQEDILSAAQELRKRGALNVLVSMGENGALLVTQDGEAFVCRAPKVDVINTVGSGDASVAGFISGYLETRSMTRALMKAVASGSASAASEELATKEGTERLMASIRIEKAGA